MRILLLGEYSNLHWTLAEGLRTLGHEVVVASDGDGFKNYSRDIDFRLFPENRVGQIKCIYSILKNKHRLKNFDVVQIINPMFTRIHRLNLSLYRFLKKHNGKIFLGAFGDDYFYTRACLDNTTYRYSEFFVNGKPTNLVANKDLVDVWQKTFRQCANVEIAQSCNGIIACLCEYEMAYKQQYSDKLTYIPLPINLRNIAYKQLSVPQKVKFFVGINRARMEIKGTDLFLKALEILTEKYENQISVQYAESLTYEEYKYRLATSDVVLDQAYSYSTAMNGLLTLASGKILVSGAEKEAYDALGEKENRPIINVYPTVEDIVESLSRLVEKRESFPAISKNGRMFVEKHHDHLNVAKQYLNFWSKH